MKKYFTLAFIFFISPVSSFALTTLKTFVDSAINNVAYGAIGLIVILAVLAFFIGIIKFLYASRNGVETGVTEGKKTMMWGMVSIFVIISFFGIIGLAKSMFGMGSATDINMPDLQSSMFGQQAGFQSMSGQQVRGVNVADQSTSFGDVNAYSSTDGNIGSFFGGLGSQISNGSNLSIGGLFDKVSNYFNSKNTPASGQETITTGNTAVDIYQNCINNGGAIDACNDVYQSLGGGGSSNTTQSSQGDPTTDFGFGNYLR